MKQKLLILLGLIFGLTSISLSAQAETPIYRLYNRSNGEHLYTTSLHEKTVLYEEHGWGYEGIAWYAPDGGTPVYRLYNAGHQNHLYTSDTNEVQVLTSSHGWTQDNNGQPVFYSNGTIPIYRVYNPQLRGLHHWTTDSNEYQVLPRYGWTQEGIKFYAERIGSPITTQFKYVAPAPTPAPSPAPQPNQPYYPNCAAVKAAGRAPIYRGQPGYGPHLDRDGDGVACEK